MGSAPRPPEGQSHHIALTSLLPNSAFTTTGRRLTGLRRAAVRPVASLLLLRARSMVARWWRGRSTRGEEGGLGNDTAAADGSKGARSGARSALFDCRRRGRVEHQNCRTQLRSPVQARLWLTRAASCTRVASKAAADRAAAAHGWL